MPEKRADSPASGARCVGQSSVESAHCCECISRYSFHDNAGHRELLHSGKLIHDLSTFRSPSIIVEYKCKGVAL